MGRFSCIGKNAVLIILAVIFLIERKTSAKLTNTKYLVIDTDMGPDDAWAVMMILRATELMPNIKLLGITCVHGNTKVENVARNVRRILSLANRCDVPVFEGASQSILKTPPIPTWFGNDGMGDLGEAVDSSFGPVCPSKGRNAIEAIGSFAALSPKGITLLSLGPLTNIALAMKSYRNLKIEEIFVMGGNGDPAHNAEFNFATDPEAASIVLENGKPPITIMPYEISDQPNLGLSLNWRFDVLGNQPSNFVQFMNLVERKLYQRSPLPWRTYSLLTAAYLFPQSIASTSSIHAKIELTNPAARGKLLVDNSTPPNVRIIRTVDPTEIKNALLWTADPAQVPSYPQYSHVYQVYYKY